MWRDERLFARDDDATSFGPADAQRFSETLAARLGVDPGYVNAAFEDPVHYLQRERQLPINVDPIDNRLEDPGERDRIRRVFERGLDKPAGYVLPLQRGIGKDGPQWQTGLWMLRGQHLFLVPGDSPLGLRLPLASLPWVEPSEAPQFFPQDPTGQLPPLPEPKHIAPAEPKLQSRSLVDVRDQKPKTGRVGAMDGSHRAVRGTARRALARLHAAAGAQRGLHRVARGDRGHGGEPRDAGRDRGLPAAARFADQPDRGDARSRRDRGQHSSGAQLGRVGRI